MGATRKIGMAAVVVTVIAGGSLAFARSGQDAGAESQAAAQTATSTGSNYGTEAGIQPIAFPHNLHAETNQIDCQYCHFSAERSFSAGIPPVSTCMGCHGPGKVQVQSEQGQQQIELLTQYFNDGEPIPWVRIHKVADHVKFPHMRHINAAVDCTQCHGPVPEMGVWQEPDPAWGNGKMGWCVSCHVEQDVSRDCTVCHY